MRLSTGECLRRATLADHGVLATLHTERGVDAIPACFIVDGDLVAIPIDEVKPKAGRPLQRVANLERDPRATLLVEHWDPIDWTRLWWVRLALRRAVVDVPTQRRCEAALRTKYRQYAEASFRSILTFRVAAVVGWSAA